MDKLKMQSENLVNENIDKIAKLFPNCITEGKDEKGQIVRLVDFDILKQELSRQVVDGNDERYSLNWAGKKQSILTANSPINATLRPCREESVDFNTTKNLYIEGDNLDVLKLLREVYLNKVKMIYIDPPYNTGHDFVYEDDFATSNDEYLKNSKSYDDQGRQMFQNNDSNGRFHSDWLSMMYSRLKVSKDLLKEDGVIFISIDDNELDNLKRLLDEIFGSDNFIARIVHKNNSMKNQSKYVGITTEYVLLYCKNMSALSESQPEWRIRKKGAADVKKMFKSLKEQGLSISEIQEQIHAMYSRPKYAHLSRWNKVDDGGVFTDKDLSRANGYKDFTIINPNTNKECLIPNRGWTKTKEELLVLQKKDLIWYGDENTPPREKSYLTDDADSVFDNFVYVDTSVDKKLLDSLLGYSVFEFPKPIEMINTFLQLCTNDNDIILDFFSGSATTAHAVMQLNADDGGNRQFIMVQLPENCDEKSEAYKNGYKTICEIGKERIRKAGKKIVEENNIDIDIGFRVLKLDSSCMKDVYYNPNEISQNLLVRFEDNIKEDRSVEDLLFQVMLDMGVLLSSEIKTLDIKGKKVFNINDGNLVCCFDKDLTDEVVIEIAKMQPLYAVFRDASMSSDSVAVNFDQIFETYSNTTTRKII